MFRASFQRPVPGGIAHGGGSAGASTHIRLSWVRLAWVAARWSSEDLPAEAHVTATAAAAKTVEVVRIFMFVTPSSLEA